jgi:hypothetical protein
MLKITLKYEQRYFEVQIHHFLCQVPPDLLLFDSAGRIARELWRKNQVSPVDIILPRFSILMYHLGDEE